MNFDMAWGAPFAQTTLASKGLSLDHMEKHIIGWTRLSQKRGYHTGLSTQVHMLLLQEPLDRIIKVLDRMHDDPKGKRVNLYYCGPQRALWAIEGVSIMSGCMTSYGSYRGFSWAAARAEAIRQATVYPGLASDGSNIPNQREMDITLANLGITVRAIGRMTDATCVYCA